MDTPWVKSSYSFSNGNCLEWRTSSRSNSGACIEAGLQDVRWRTSSVCDGGACVEVAPSVQVRAPSVQVRDSKLGDASPIVRFSPAVWQSFTEGLKNS